MRRVTRGTTFGLQRRVFVSERSLLVGVTLNARSISADGQSGLFELKAAMWIVAVAALHHSFQHLVMERLVEVGSDFTVTAYAKLRVAHLQQLGRCEPLFLRIGFADERYRVCQVFPGLRGMRSVAISATYVVAPVFAAAEIIVLFPAGMTSKTSFRDFF